MVTLRQRVVAIIGATMMFATVFFAGGAALAQTGYPPGTSVPSCIPGNANAGTVSIGQTITFTLCGNFAAGAAITVTVNGGIVLTKTPTNGAVIVVVHLVSATVAEIGDPVNAAIVCGNNAVTATGLSASGGTASSTGTFNLSCATAPTGGKGLAFTGANIAKALVIALVLIALGAGLVLAQRRRRRSI